MRLSDQALGAIMMALQKSLVEQSDIVPVLKSFRFIMSKNEELMVSNPPSFNINDLSKNIEEDTGDQGLDENTHTVGSD